MSGLSVCLSLGLIVLFLGSVAAGAAEAQDRGINIYNPSDSVAMFVKNLVVTLPPGMQRPVKPGCIGVDSLAPTLALATDCNDLGRRSNNRLPPFFEGFVLIDSSHGLDVVAVYTVPGVIDVLHVPERIRQR